MMLRLPPLARLSVSVAPFARTARPSAITVRVLSQAATPRTSLRGLRQISPTTSLVLQQQLGAITHFSNWNRPKGGGNRLAQGAGLIGAASVLIGKSKYLLGALKVTKFASLGSMILSIGTYSMFFGLPYAAGMVGLLLVHESGHALVMLNRGIPFSPMVFMPFVGAVVAMRRQPRDAWEDALVALGGPFLGSAGAGAVALTAHATNSQLLFALADFGFMINLFNLLPIGSLDGGRVASALSPYAGVAGLGLGGVVAYSGAVSNPIFYLVLLSGGYETFQRFYNPHHLPPNYYRITAAQRSAMTAGYFGLVAALVVAMDANQRYRKPPEVLIHEREMEQHWDMR